MPYIKGEWRSFTLAEVCLQGQTSGLFIEDGSASVCFSQLDNSRLTMERLHVWRFFLRVLKRGNIEYTAATSLLSTALPIYHG